MSAWKRTTVALALVAVGAASVGAKEANQILVDGSTTVGPIAKAFAEYYMGRHPGVNVTVSESGSGNGAKSLIRSACDVADMSRPMEDAEVKAAQAAGLNPVQHVVAMDGIAIIVHPSNPVANLTREQVRDIYRGAITSWKQVGGPPRPIVVISRDTNSGTYETFGTMVMQGQKIAPSVEYVGSNGAVRERVMATPEAIGYVGMGFVAGVKPLAIEGVTLGPGTVRSRTYPISRPLYMYTNGDPKAGTPLADFIGLCTTPAGKKLITDLGFVPLSQ